MSERNRFVGIVLGLTVVIALVFSVYTVTRGDLAESQIAAGAESEERSIAGTGADLPFPSTSILDLEVEPPLPQDPSIPSMVPTTTPDVSQDSTQGPSQSEENGAEPPDRDAGDRTPPPSAASVATASGPIELSGESNTVIEGLAISNPDGDCVVIDSSVNVTIRDSRIGPCGGKAVVIERSSSVRLEGLRINDSASGVYALQSDGVAVVGNIFRNSGRNFVQFDKVTGAGNTISDNSGSNRLGGSNAEDLISVYRSSGTTSSPLLVIGNSFRDGGPSTSGSGIMVGDDGGAHIVVSNNTLINPGHVGIGVPGGTDIRVLSNSVFSDAHPWSNVGIYVWNQSGASCGDIEVRGNRVEWYSADGSPNPFWDGENCGTVMEWDDNDWNASLG